MGTVGLGGRSCAGGVGVRLAQLVGGGGPTCPQRGTRDGQGGTVGGGRQGRERVVTDNLGRMIALFKKYFIFIIFYLAVLGLS